MTAGFASRCDRQMQKHHAALSPRPRVRTSVQKRGDDGGIRVVPSRQMQRRQAKLIPRPRVRTSVHGAR